MLSLVNYGSDSDDSNHSDDESQSAGVVNFTSEKKSGSNGPSTSAVKKFSKFGADSDEEDPLNADSETFKVLPQPVSKAAADEFEEGPIPPKKVYDGQIEEKPPTKAALDPQLDSLKAKRFGGKTLISIPSLRDFDEQESDVETKPKLIQPAKKGSGLFAVLPPPKCEVLAKTVNFTKQPAKPQANAPGSSQAESSTDFVKPPSGSLIPDAVRQNMLGKRPPVSKLDEIRSKYLRQEANVKIVSRGSKAAKKTGGSSDEESEREHDFFSFGAASEQIPEDPSLRLQEIQPPPIAPASDEDQDMDDEDEEEPGPSAAPVDPMQFIREGRKNKEPINFIDVKADDLRPDSVEWMRNLTEEQVVIRKGGGPGGMTKRKHQITYLAFEAKAREQELKNQWAQAKHNKQITRSKYGF